MRDEIAVTQVIKDTICYGTVFSLMSVRYSL